MWERHDGATRNDIDLDLYLLFNGWDKDRNARSQSHALNLSLGTCSPSTNHTLDLKHCGKKNKSGDSKLKAKSEFRMSAVGMRHFTNN